MTLTRPGPSLSSLRVSNDLPAIPGRRRSVYTTSRRRLFGRKQAPLPSFGSGSGRAGRGGGARSGRRWPKRTLIGLISLVVLLIVFAIGSYVYIDIKLGGMTRVPVSALTPLKPGEPMDILLIGSDSRSCETSAAQAAAFGSKTTVTGQRSDTIIVARLLSGGRVEMLSIPRDTWVPIAGTGGSSKINSAFNNGPNPLVETIQDNFHIPINHVMMVNICGFPDMVDALGGIYMNFPDPVKDSYSGLYETQTGCQLVNGAQALALVRSRHLWYYSHGWNYDGMSDFSRIKRQQAFFHALLERVHSVVPNVFRLSSFTSAAVSGLAVDSSFSSNEMIAIGWDYHSLSESNLSTSLLPTTESVIDGQDVLLPAQSLDQTVISAFLSGEVGTFTSTLGAPPHNAYLTSSEVVTGVFPEPWNPQPC
jgi:polyisoprenyl-teichoic acid--peptidoglycan teichoic acid transferase